ncbi:MAG TPA: virulence RhuM family protein [Balneolales bacterium]|nr:virulence RhuM family protein [Balneolales bacterium]
MDNKELPSNDLVLYSTSSGDVKVEVFVYDETVWLTQKRLAELFGVDRSVVTKHLNNIFNEGELDKDSVCALFAHTAEDGKTYQTQFYNLDAIISVGYRVNSYQATQFRIWATRTLKEFITKGFVLDDDRLKQGKTLFGKDYFDELIERVREIRASERRFYQKITDIYAQCSIDYDPKSPITKEFYATVQNKLHWAITGKTAAEIIAKRANAQKSHMGLTNWKKAPDGKVLKSDVRVAKNYLSEKEIKELNRIVTMYLDYAELQAEKQRPMKMIDWIKKLDGFLQFNDYEILKNPGQVKTLVAKNLA